MVVFGFGFGLYCFCVWGRGFPKVSLDFARFTGGSVGGEGGEPLPVSVGECL